MRRDEIAVSHVHERRLDRRHARAARHRNAGRLERRTVAGDRQRTGFVAGDGQQFVHVVDDRVRRLQISHVASVERRRGDLGHCRVGERLRHELEILHAARCGSRFGRADRRFLQAAAARHEADANLHETDVALERRHSLGAMEQQLAAAAQRNAGHRGDDRHLRVLHAHHAVLEFLDEGLDPLRAAHHEGGHGRFQIGAGGERTARRAQLERRRLPHDHAAILLLGQIDGAGQAVDDVRPDGVHLRLERDDEHVVLPRGLVDPQTHGVVLFDGLAELARIGAGVAHERCREYLTLINRQRAARNESVLRRVVRALGRVHAAGVGHLAARHPRGQRRVRERLACVDIFLHPLGDVFPARGLPVFERPRGPAEAPADREVDFAGVVGDLLQIHADVVEHVAEHGPQELRLRVGRFAQQAQTLGRGLLQNAHDHFVGLLARLHVLARLRVEHLDDLAVLLVETSARLLAQRALLHQRLEHGRRGVRRGERVVLEAVLHRLDDVRHGVQTDHVGRTERGRLGAAKLAAGQVVDDIERNAVLLRFGKDGQNREDADTVGDEVRRILRTHHALAERGGEERFELIEDGRRGGRGRNQLDQMHVARRVEEVHAAEARLQVGVEAFREFGDRQTRRVRREDRMLGQMRRNLLVKVVLPVHALGDRFDHHVAAGELLEVVLVVRNFDELRIGLVGERRGAQLLQAVDGARDDAVLRAFLGRQIEQHDGHFRVDEVRCDLRTHHAGAEHGDLADNQGFVGLAHGDLLRSQNRSTSTSISVFAPARAMRICDAVSGSSLAK